MEVILAAIIGTVIGAVIGYAIARAQDRAVNERINAERERTLNESVRGMLAEVTNVTNEALKAREKDLAAKNSEQMTNLMAPMKVQLEAVQKATEAARKTNGDLGIKLEDCFKVLQSTTSEVGKTAQDFITAVRGSNKKQGNWGEAILGKILEDCGLKRDEHFFAQRGSGKLIPDFQVLDPGSQKILVIDSKMSWTKYEEAYRLEDGPERKAALAEHVASVRKHINELAETNYPANLESPKKGYGYIPLTAMFVPSDAALKAALEEDPSLVDAALKKSIALVTPVTLFGFMQLVSRAWSNYNIDRNSLEIQNQAKLLVERVDKLFSALEDVGGAIEKARAKHEAVMKLASREAAGQCIKGPALKIIKLGGRPTKELKSGEMHETA